MNPRYQSILIAFLVAISVKADTYSIEGLYGEDGQHFDDALSFATMAGALTQLLMIYGDA